MLTVIVHISILAMKKRIEHIGFNSFNNPLKYTDPSAYVNVGWTEPKAPPSVGYSANANYGNDLAQRALINALEWDARSEQFYYDIMCLRIIKAAEENRGGGLADFINIVVEVYGFIEEEEDKGDGDGGGGNGGVEPGLSFNQVADDIRKNGENRFVDYVSSPYYGGCFFVNAAENYSPKNFQNWIFAPESVNFGRRVGRWGHQYFPNPDFGELRHIVGSYVIAEKYNPIIAYNVTWGNEYIGLGIDIINIKSRFNGSEWAFQYSDVFHNYKGIWYSIKY